MVNHDCSCCGADSKDGGGGAEVGVGVGFSFGAAAAKRVTEDEITRTFLCNFTEKSDLTRSYALAWRAERTA